MSNPENNKPEGKDEETLGSFYMGRMRPPQEPERVMPKGLLTIVSVIAFAVIIWYAYPKGQEKYEGADIPVITADKSAYKFQPDDPGGMEVRHQDSTVFDPLENKNADDVEKVLPDAEEPLDKEKEIAENIELDSKKPDLNLDLQMKEVSDGMEKVVSKSEEAAKAEAFALAAKKAAEEKAAELRAEAEATAVKPTTKAVDKATSAEKVATQKSTTASGFYMQLGSYRDPSGAKKDWAIMQKKYPQYLSGLSFRTEKVDLGAKGTWYRLYAGALKEDKARKLCASLKSANPGGCIVAKM